MNRPWMPLYIADYRADTAHLTALEHGVYILLIMHYWQTGGLPDDDAQLARIASATAAEWRRCKPKIEGFFTPGWKHARIDHELGKATALSGKRRDAAMSMLRQRDVRKQGAADEAIAAANHAAKGAVCSSKQEANAKQLLTQSHSQSHSPSQPESESDSNSGPKRDSVGGLVKAKRDGASPPRHGASTMKAGGRVYIRKGTTEWDAYAEDFRSVHGSDPVANSDGGRWFRTVGEGSG